MPRPSLEDRESFHGRQRSELFGRLAPEKMPGMIGAGEEEGEGRCDVDDWTAGIGGWVVGMDGWMGFAGFKGGGLPPRDVYPPA